MWKSHVHCKTHTQVSIKDGIERKSWLEVLVSSSCPQEIVLCTFWQRALSTWKSTAPGFCFQSDLENKRWMLLLWCVEKSFTCLIWFSCQKSRSSVWKSSGKLVFSFLKFYINSFSYVSHYQVFSRASGIVFLTACFFSLQIRYDFCFTSLLTNFWPY